MKLAYYKGSTSAKAIDRWAWLYAACMLINVFGCISNAFQLHFHTRVHSGQVWETVLFQDHVNLILDACFDWPHMHVMWMHLNTLHWH